CAGLDSLSSGRVRSCRSGGDTAARAAWRPSCGRMGLFRASRRSIERLPILPMCAIADRTALRAVLFAFLSAVVAMLVLVPSPDAKMRQERLTIIAATGAHEILVEVAETPEEKSVGLMFRRSVPEGTGMLFPYPAPQEVTM